MKIELPLAESVQTSLMLVLYRWRDKHYDNGVKNSNDVGAVVAIINIINDMLQGEI